MNTFQYTIAAVIDAFQLPVAFAVFVAGSAAVLACRSRVHALVLAVSSIGAWSAATLLKLTFAIPRPDTALIEATGYRFPSIHAAVAGAFFGSLAISTYILSRSKKTRVAGIILAVLAVLVVCWSRVFLQVHLPIDVLSGAALGFAIACISHRAFRGRCFC